MLSRDNLFIQFGPKLIESLFFVLLDEINTLRSAQGQPIVSMQDLIDNASNHVNSSPDYSWMSYPIP
ncbi:hypothetical protein LCGC14_0817800 [marine sediment metagenome]|uniref:Uncharacterized protein n=1 Tax=marine sediment metagenome TaxID=412755 RepID=A0A0F9S4Q3_9ZZZZ